MSKDEKQIIIDYARELFLEMDNTGTKTPTFDIISTKLRQKFGVEFHRSTIQKWAKKHDWYNITSEIKEKAFDKATKKNKIEINSIIERKAEILAEDYANAERLERGGYEIMFTFLEDKEDAEPNQYFEVKDALAAIESGLKNKYRIMEVKDPSAGNQTVNIVSLGNGVKPD